MSVRRPSLNFALVVGAALLASAAAAPPAPTEATPSSTLPADVQARLGVTTAPAEAMRYAPTVDAYARVLDPTPLATLDSDLAAAIAAAAASQAEAARSRALNADDQMVAAKVAEAAAAQAVGDRARLSLLRLRIGLEWGPGVAGLGDGGRRDLLQAIARGDAALVRIDVPGGLQPTGVVSLDLGPAGHAPVRILGPARTGDPRLQAGGWLGVASGAAARTLSVGLAAPARFSTQTAVDGVKLPDGAVLRSEGQSWVYVKTAPDKYERRVLGGVAATPGGLFAASGVRAGEIVVTRGASALFTAEAAAG